MERDLQVIRWTSCRTSTLRRVLAAALAVAGIHGHRLHAQVAATRPTTVPANWEPQYGGYVSNADVMVRLIGISEQQRRVARDRLLLMSYELEQWEQRQGREAGELQAAFHRIDSHKDPKGKLVAFYAWEAALAPKDKIRDEHLTWIDQNVLTAEQRDKWAAHELTLSVGFIEANGLITVAQSFRVRPLALEVTAELPGNYRDPRVSEARKRRLIERIKTEILTPEQAARLDALLRLREEARKEYEATTRPAETQK
jgi:hypothetical protein